MVKNECEGLENNGRVTLGDKMNKNFIIPQLIIFVTVSIQNKTNHICIYFYSVCIYSYGDM